MEKFQLLIIEDFIFLTWEYTIEVEIDQDNLSREG